MFLVDVSGVGKAVAAMLHERGFFFHPVTWVAGDSAKEHRSDGWRVGKQYLMAHVGATLSAARLQIIEPLRDGAGYGPYLGEGRCRVLAWARAPAPSKARTPISAWKQFLQGSYCRTTHSISRIFRCPKVRVPILGPMALRQPHWGRSSTPPKADPGAG